MTRAAFDHAVAVILTASGLIVAQLTSAALAAALGAPSLDHVTSIAPAASPILYRSVEMHRDLTASAGSAPPGQGPSGPIAEGRRGAARTFSGLNPLEIRLGTAFLDREAAR